jgi:hypothetical protein
MEKNTVLLGIEEYNNLRDFKENITKGNSFQTKHYNYVWGSNTTFVTENEAVKILISENDNMKQYCQKTEEQIKNLLQNKPKEITLADLKKMSYWQFRQWRKS